MSVKKTTTIAASAITAAAITGLFAGSAYASVPVEGIRNASSNAINLAGTKASNALFNEEAGKHDCKGKNTCKGQGGCKSGDNGCKGKNSCKGHGGCATNHE